MNSMSKVQPAILDRDLGNFGVYICTPSVGVGYHMYLGTNLTTYAGYVTQRLDDLLR